MKKYCVFNDEGVNKVKKIIGITCKEYKDYGAYFQSSSEDYIGAIIRAGGVPVLLPISGDSEIILKQVEMIDGLVIMGGIDISPLSYGENCTYEQGDSSFRRDMHEKELILTCAQKEVPILGICRGHQMINVAFGGTLYQDNRMKDPNVYQHYQKEKKQFPIHSIDIKDHTFLSHIFGETAMVNSYHHQSIKDLAEGFQISAVSEDGLVEAIEHQSLKIYGVQFHPETMAEQNKNMQQIFNDFIKIV